MPSPDAYDRHVKNDIEVVNKDWVSATEFLTGIAQGVWMVVQSTYLVLLRLALGQTSESIARFSQSRPL